MDSYDILVIILSVTLAVFLFSGIAVLLKVRELVVKIEQVVDTAQHAAENVEEITSKISTAASVSAFGTVAGKIVNAFKKGGK